ncbi:DUF6183 family protein [Nocardia sp. AG03]|uniref:DUF6183 family protein n=1 Tax=Nocardia sp. AG03 TaxID=3025312 RepID=UPI0024185762|nr:DUF6183 family protein [Nocardia sp. AG03]
MALARAVATAHGGDHLFVAQCLRAILARPVSGKVSAALEVVAVMRPPKARARHIATCLAGSLNHEEAVAESTPADVWSILFAAAADGGAYNTGEGAAYGRLYAWRSLGALCGASEFDTVDHIARLAADARWLAFAATTAWFERVAWDIGIAALTPEPGVTVLAATDTD